MEAHLCVTGIQKQNIFQEVPGFNLSDDPVLHPGGFFLFNRRSNFRFMEK
jgi:hypothetical protein